jgi:activator of Hsp90 ATPase-like protein
VIIRKSIEVEAPVERAFDVYTNGMGSWWPMATHSLGHGQVVDVVFEPRIGGLVYEVWDDGSRREWADVVAYDAPHSFELRWRVGEGTPTRLALSFTAVDDGTRVELVHDGWDDAERFESYDNGWEGVLSSFLSSSALGGAKVSQSLLK